MTLATCCQCLQGKRHCDNGPYWDIGCDKFLWAMPTPRPPRAPRGPCEKNNFSAEQLKTFANGIEIPLVLRTLATSCQCHPLKANRLFINVKISYFSAYGAVPTLQFTPQFFVVAVCYYTA